MRIIKCQQRSTAWFQAHCGNVSASGMEAVLDFTQKGAAGAKRKTYFRQKFAELCTGIAIQDNYVSREMLIGIEREPLGIAAYESEEGLMVDTIGFALHDSIPRFGCSPDGLVGDEGLIELKCPLAGTHLQYILDGVIPDLYLSQIRAQLCVTGRAWCDFVSFCPEVPKPARLMVIRFPKIDADMELVAEAVQKFNGEVDAAVEKLRSIVGPFELPAQIQREPEMESKEQEARISDDDIAWAIENLGK
jgi:exodeoxyribonuclease (lambda-induced)